MNNLEYALETIDTSVIVLSRNGALNYFNPQAKAVFAIWEEHSQKPITEVLTDVGGKNKELIDRVFDVLTSGEQKKSSILPYTDPAGNTLYLLMSCNIISDSEFVFTFSDHTELIKEGQKRIDSTTVLTSFFLISCLWTVAVSIWNQTGRVFEVGYLTIIMEAMATINMIILLNKTSFRLKDLGLSTERLVPTLKRTAVRVIMLFSVFCAIKLVVLQFFPGVFPKDAPFWDWSQADFRVVKYIFSAFIQEFLSRGGVQESLSRVFDGKYRKDNAIHVTSLFFMALHFQYGLPMMFGAGALSILLGYCYKKDQNIYGVTIIHYCFGKFADFLNFL